MPRHRYVRHKPWPPESTWSNGIQLVSLRSQFTRAPGPLQQSILDELDGALQSGKSIRNIAGWLNSVVEKANDGTLILGLADDIADIHKETRAPSQNLNIPFRKKRMPQPKTPAAASSLKHR